MLMNRFAAIAVAAMFFGVPAYGLVVPTTAVRTVALAGDSAPGTSAGVVFREFGHAVLNDAGLTSFRGRLAGPGTSENNSWAGWSEGGGALHPVARAGHPAPLGGFFTDNIVTPQLNNLGHSFFWADVAGGILYSEVNGAFSRLAFPGMQAAGAPAGVTYQPIWAGYPTFPVNDLGQYLFVTTLTGPGVGDGNRHGLWIGTGTGHQLVARAGNPAPGTEPGTVFVTTSSDTFSPTPTLSPGGKIAFTTLMNGPNVPSNGRQGVWVGTPGNLALAIRSGTQPPGGLAGSYIHDFSPAVLNEAGDVAVLAGVFGNGTNSSNDRGIYVVRDGALDQVARKGQAAPGAGGGVYGAVGLPAMNKWGDVAFTGTVSGVGSGVWKEKNGVAEAVVLSTDDAPGGMPGEHLTSFDEPLFNDLGQVAFLAGTNFGRTGIWAEDIDGVLRKLVVEGDTVEYRPGEFGTAGDIGFDSIIGFAGSQDGWASSFNAKGQLAFEAAIGGRNGVFVSSLVAVPEPASATLSALAVCAGLLGSNRRNKQQV